MKSYIYIVITKELFRQSIVGIERGSHGGGSAACPSPLRLIPPEQDFCGITSPRASCRGATGADALCLGAEPGTAQAPDPSQPRHPPSCTPLAPAPPGSRRSRGRSCASGPAARGRSPSPTAIPPTRRHRAPVTPSLTNLPSAAGRASPLPPCVKCNLKLYHFNKIN